MPAALARRSVRPAPRRRARAAIAVVRRRARAAAKPITGTLISTAAAAGYGLLEKQGTNLPSVGGVDPALLWGAVLAVAGPMVLKGKGGTMLAHAGAGLLAVGAHSMASGQSVGAGGWGSSDTDVGNAGWEQVP